MWIDQLLVVSDCSGDTGDLAAIMPVKHCISEYNRYRNHSCCGLTRWLIGMCLCCLRRIIIKMEGARATAVLFLFLIAGQGAMAGLVISTDNSDLCNSNMKDCRLAHHKQLPTLPVAA